MSDKILLKTKNVTLTKMKKGVEFAGEGNAGAIIHDLANAYTELYSKHEALLCVLDVVKDAAKERAEEVTH